MVSKKISFELEGAMGLRTTKVRTKKRSGLQGKKNGEPPLSLVIKIMKFSYRMFAIMSYRGITIILSGLIMGSFIACWFPFFLLYSISPVCPVCEANKERSITSPSPSPSPSSSPSSSSSSLSSPAGPR